MKELLIRSATGLVYGLLLLGSVLLHPHAFFCVYLGICILSTKEFISLSRREGASPMLFPILTLAGLTFVFPFLIFQYQINKLVLIAIPALLIIFLIAELFRKSERPLMNISFMVFGLIYVAVPFGLINFLAFSPYTGTFSAQIVIFLMMVLWTNDSGAYFAGSLFGRHKLFERISPKKTWEGLLGGILIAALVTLIFGSFFTEIPRVHQWFLASGIIIFGTFGDLFESMWKRSLSIKDSGRVLPGHGGWLDRLDSLLFAIPATVIIIFILNSFN